MRRKNGKSKLNDKVYSCFERKNGKFSFDFTQFMQNQEVFVSSYYREACGFSTSGVFTRAVFHADHSLRYISFRINDV